ncbi:PBSX family phage terminase large subunit [Erysipelothrix sp. HDW6A]|nr:PBSX family phage terminase large subunit [Erysipelothrix sp. HDW6A]
MIELNISSKCFNPIYLEHMMNNQNRKQHYFGGSSSGKSFSLAQRTVLDVLEGRNYLICRNVATTIKRSVFNEIVKAMNNFKVRKYFDVNKSDFVITCTLNQSQILFTGLDDTEKVKSITPIKGVLTDIWVEEATECNLKSIKQLEKRLRGRSKFKKRMTFSYNPVLKTSWLYTEYFNGLWQDDKQYVEGNDVSILKTTYKDNLFLSQDDVDGMENETDPYHYEVYTLGNWGVLGAVIFKNWKVKEFDKEAFEKYRHGNDWGFSDDPFAYVRVSVDELKKKKKLYICDDLQATNLSNEEAAELIRPIVASSLITSDSAEPKSIEKFKELRINAKAAKKGPGSLEFGIKFLQSLEIIVHPSCQNIINELSVYRFKEDKSGNVLPIPVDKDNHGIDALRYALESDMVERKVRTRKGLY